MSQNLRVALWVPNVDPASIGNAIRTTDVPSANKVIPSEFAAGGGGGGVVFADQGEVSAGLIPDEAIAPRTLRQENVRLFDIPEPAFLGPIVIITSTGAPSANKLVKSNASGLIDDTLLELDGGTF
jgi:hypothetical protein